MGKPGVSQMGTVSRKFLLLPGAAARSPLKTVHWTVFRALRAPQTHPSSQTLMDIRLIENFLKCN